MATTKPTLTPQLSERIGIVETKVENLSEKLDDLKVDLKEIHESLSTDRKSLSDQLDKMYKASCEQHAELGKKLSELEKFKNKWAYLIIGAVAALGWAAGHSDALGIFK
jgi:dsDNA-specific endonuclease/ATPase MutS2